VVEINAEETGRKGCLGYRRELGEEGGVVFANQSSERGEKRYSLRIRKSILMKSHQYL